MLFIILSLVTVVGATIGINYWLNRRRETTPPSIPPVTGGSGGSGGGGTGITLPSYTLCDAYLVGGEYQPYASAQDAIDKNTEGSGFTNRSKSLFANTLTSGEALYLNADASTKVTGPMYFYAPAIRKGISVNANGVLSIFTGTIQNLPPFVIKDAYLNGNYAPYGSLNEALDKNLEGSGATNRDATVYASSMQTGQKAYTSAAATQPFPQGNYFYPLTFEMLSIAVDGTMTFSTDVSKNGINPMDIKDSYQ